MSNDLIKLLVMCAVGAVLIGAGVYVLRTVLGVPIPGFIGGAFVGAVAAVVLVSRRNMKDAS